MSWLNKLGLFSNTELKAKIAALESDNRRLTLTISDWQRGTMNLNEDLRLLTLKYEDKTKELINYQETLDKVLKRNIKYMEENEAVEIKSTIEFDLHELKEVNSLNTNRKENVLKKQLINNIKDELLENAEIFSYEDQLTNKVKYVIALKVLKKR